MERFASLIPGDLLEESSKVFYSGRAAFRNKSLFGNSDAAPTTALVVRREPQASLEPWGGGAIRPRPSRLGFASHLRVRAAAALCPISQTVSKCDLYALGLNPGGDPESDQESKIGKHTSFVVNIAPDEWSAYCDEAWSSYRIGQSPFQLRMQHLFKRIHMNPRNVPSSNLIFRRSRSFEELEKYNEFKNSCWTFHSTVVREMAVKMIICLGSDCANYVRMKLDANKPIDCFTEDNNRRWRSCVFRNSDGLFVIQLTHPSRADWTSDLTDPSALVMSILSGNRG